jgi:hypothetical protein
MLSWPGANLLFEIAGYCVYPTYQLDNNVEGHPEVGPEAGALKRKR